MLQKDIKRILDPKTIACGFVLGASFFFGIGKIIFAWMREIIIIRTSKVIVWNHTIAYLPRGHSQLPVKPVSRF